MVEFKRPASLPFPTVWHTFTARDIDSDEMVTYTVEDIPKERFDEVVEFYKVHFLPFEPKTKLLNILGDEVSLKEIEGVWRDYLSQNISFGCFKEGSDELVGANILFVNRPNAPKRQVRA